MIIEFEIPGPPMGKGRHRTTKTGYSYTPKETVSYENLVKMCCREVYKGDPHQGQVEALIVACYPIPKSTSKKRAHQMATGYIRPIIKPDWDNIGKIVCDALNHIVYRDDAQIVDARVRKFFSERPRVAVTLTLTELGAI